MRRLTGSKTCRLGPAVSPQRPMRRPARSKARVAHSKMPYHALVTVGLSPNGPGPE